MLSANYEAFCVVEKGIKSVFNLTNLIYVLQQMKSFDESKSNEQLNCDLDHIHHKHFT